MSARDRSDDEEAGLHERLVETFPGMAYRCLHDADWTLEFVSQGAERLLGFTVDDLVTRRTVAVADLIHPDDLAKVSLQVEKGLTAKQPFGCIYRMRNKAGDFIWVSEVGRGVFDADGNLVAIEGFLSNVTAEVEAQARNRVTERRDVVARMASGIAHDFNNILTGIHATVESIGEVPSGIADDLNVIRQLTKRAANLTKQLLTFGQARPVKSDPIDLTHAMTTLAPLLAGLVGPDVEITSRGLDRPVVCRMDQVQLEQIVINLVVNARDAMPAGGRIEISVSVDETEGVALISVTDDGEGIDEAHLSRLFEPYFTTKGSERGTGLGLATVSAIVEEAEGTVVARSRLGHGATFEVRLPLIDSLDTSQDTGGSEVILLVEDDDVVRRAFAKGLRRLGYTVLEGSDGRQAIDIIERHKGPLDLLITDGRMPRVSGLELAEHLREERPSVPAILITGDQISGPPGLFAARHAKPITVNELAASLRQVLDGR